MFGNNDGKNGVTLNQPAGLTTNPVGVPSIDTPPSPPPAGTADPSIPPAIIPFGPIGAGGMQEPTVSPAVPSAPQQDIPSPLEFRRGPFDPKLPGEESKPFTEGALHTPSVDVDAGISLTPAAKVFSEKQADTQSEKVEVGQKTTSSGADLENTVKELGGAIREFGTKLLEQMEGVNANLIEMRKLLDKKEVEEKISEVKISTDLPEQKEKVTTDSGIAKNKTEDKDDDDNPLAGYNI